MRLKTCHILEELKGSDHVAVYVRFCNLRKVPVKHIAGLEVMQAMRSEEETNHVLKKGNWQGSLWFARRLEDQNQLPHLTTGWEIECLS